VVRHSHALFELAKLSAELVMLEHDTGHHKAGLRVKFAKKFKSKWELDDAISLDDYVEKLNVRISGLEAKRHIVEGIAKGYDGLARAASREISRRISEQAPKD
jgi:hypothetical protein